MCINQFDHHPIMTKLSPMFDVFDAVDNIDDDLQPQQQPQQPLAIRNNVRCRKMPNIFNVFKNLSTPFLLSCYPLIIWKFYRSTMLLLLSLQKNGGMIEYYQFQ
ncbi:hypothetical protein DERP_009422 [Dermatophagoides pteronyssinus]|uniref:Uncharacterized protein n=1 Tax=Dermatophagoides pteronyssinus TaxID=6956 RepID=A0ABQ8IU28_DERPT|nr:hypothetical protein DERP_009422 [Dermatophagoides pteronyssinus]